MSGKYFLFPILIFALLLTAGCSQKAEQASATKDEGSILAEVEGETITVEEYTERIMNLPLKVRKEVVDKEGKKKALDDMIKEKLLFKEAIKQGYDQNQHVVEQLEKIRRGLILQSFVQDLLKQDIPISEDKIVNYYKEHKDEFDRPEMVKASHIVVSDEDTSKKVLSELKQGKDFSELAKKYSNDTGTSWKGGDLGYFPKGKMSPEFDKAVFALKEGDISDIVKDVYGYHIIKLTSRVPYIESTLTPSVKSNIKRKFVRKKQEEIINNFVDELREQYKVRSNEELLDTVAIPRYSGGHGSFMGSGGGHGSFMGTGSTGGH